MVPSGICTASARLHVWKNLAVMNGTRVNEGSAMNETKMKGAAHCREE